MKKLIKTNWQTITFAAIAIIGFLLVTQTQVTAQGKAKVGNRVVLGGYENEKGTIKEIGSGFQLSK